MHALLVAIQFLTRIPIPLRIPFEHQLLSRSTIYFPFVGSIIGGLLAALTFATGNLFPDYIAAMLILAFWIAITGALHLDGLLDSADGLLSSRAREDMLRIMKDSRIGAMGTVVAVVYIALKVALIYALLNQYSLQMMGMLLVMVPMFSRWTMILSMVTSPNARGNQGLASSYQATSWRQIVLATFVLLVILFFLFTFFMPLSTHWIYITLAFFATSIVVCFLFSYYCYRKLGGMTGDTYGALNEIIEIVLLLMLTIQVG
jgi:adenosylcobinamide-GDP ribazoletransferase